MPLPRSRDLSLGANVPIPSSLLNDLQDQVVAQKMNVRGSNFHHVDHFVGITQPDPNYWVKSLSSGGAVQTVDDSAAGANGAISLLDGSGTGASDMYSGATFNIGTHDFWWSARVRVVTLPAGGEFTFGLFSGLGDGLTCALILQGSTLTLLTSTSPTVDTPLVVTGFAAGTTYHEFELVRSGGTLSLWINGNLSRSVAFTQNLSGTLEHFQVHSASGTSECRIDRSSLWFVE